MTLDNTSPEVAGTERFAFTVDGKRYPSDAAVKAGRQLLEIAGLAPASDYVLIQLTRPGSRLIGLDVDVDLAAGREEEFRAFSSDRAFSFTLNELGYEWGAGEISESELRTIGDVSADQELVLDRAEEDEVVPPGTPVDLASRGVEHLYTEKRLVTVYYGGDETPFELPRGRYTGATLAEKFKVPDGYILDLVKPDGEFKPIGPNDTVKLRHGMHFVSHPPVGHSS